MMLIEWLLSAACAVLMVICLLEYLLIQKLERNGIALERWAELRINEQRKDLKKLEERLDGLQELIPKGTNGELIRHEKLLRERNDEIERQVAMERDFSMGLNSILNYSIKANRGEST